MLVNRDTGEMEVSIHAFRGEGDTTSPTSTQRPTAFQSTPSGGKATDPLRPHPTRFAVSIHAFRGEGDETVVQLLAKTLVSIHAFRGEGDRSSTARATG